MVEAPILQTQGNGNEGHFRRGSASECLTTGAEFKGRDIEAWLLEQERARKS